MPKFHREKGFLRDFKEPKVTPLTEVAREVENEMGFTAMKLVEDEDFAESFISAVPDREEQKKFLVNTSRYEHDPDGKGYDPHYVLFFRRTLPSNESKPEERWSNEYMTIRNGLRREIPEGPHRFHSIILCDSLEHILEDGEKQGETNPFTDGEMVVNHSKYRQTDAICRFKPKHERDELQKYLERDDALTADEVLELVKKEKGVSQPQKTPPSFVEPTTDNDIDDLVW